MEAKIVMKNGRRYKIFPECCYIVKRIKIIKNRYEPKDEGFKRTTYYCNKLKKSIKKKYCKGCMLYNPLIYNNSDTHHL